jgi:hypothetical protein
VGRSNGSDRRRHPRLTVLLPDPPQERLNAIEESRRADAEARRAEVHAASDPRENVRAFLDAFEADRSRVELALTAERDAGASGKPADDLRRALESLQEDVLAMERRTLRN